MKTYTEDAFDELVIMQYDELVDEVALGDSLVSTSDEVHGVRALELAVKPAAAR